MENSAPLNSYPFIVGDVILLGIQKKKDKLTATKAAQAEPKKPIIRYFFMLYSFKYIPLNINVEITTETQQTPFACLRYKNSSPADEGLIKLFPGREYYL